MKNVRDCFEPFTFDALKNVKIDKHFENSDSETLVLNYSKYTKYISCPFKFNLGYNLGFSRPSGNAANRGTIFHNIMEKINLKLIDGEEISIDELEDITHEAYKSMFDIDENPQEYEEFKNNVIRYHKKYSINRDVLEAELPFEIDRTGYILNGAIDLVYKEGDDEIVILDYKYSDSSEEKIETYTKQLLLYAAALNEMPEFKDYTIKKAITHFVLNDDPHVVDITEEKIKDQLDDIDRVACEINDKNNNYSPKVSEDCEKCSYRIFCKRQ